MKKVLCALLVLMLLTGCSGWLQNDYLSIEPHVEPSLQSDAEEAPLEETPVVSNRTELRSEILSLVRSWTEQGTILVKNYRGKLSDDLTETVTYATQEDPIGAYAVDFADAELTGDETEGSIALRVVFRRSAAEIDAIIAVEDTEAARQRIYQALEHFENSLTLRIRDYDETDFAALIREYCLSHPESVAELPSLSAELYPHEGEIRILELHFSYVNSKEVMRRRLDEVNTILTSAESYVRNGTDAGQRAELLFRFLTERTQYTILEEEPVMPAYTLLCQGQAHTVSFAAVFRAVCEAIGTECLTVSGTHQGQAASWNLLQVQGEYYAVDMLQAVIRGDTELKLLDNVDLAQGGYVWDTEAYPAVALRPEPVSEEN